MEDLLRDSVPLHDQLLSLDDVLECPHGELFVIVARPSNGRLSLGETVRRLNDEVADIADSKGKKWQFLSPRGWLFKRAP